MPPQLRREVYEALGLRVTVSADGGMLVEARVGQSVIRYSHEVERYAVACGRPRGGCGGKSGRAPPGGTR